MRCVLVSCCGLPAAGKTTFCRTVFSDTTDTSAVSTTSTAAAAAKSQWKNGVIRQGGAQIRVSHVCFDEHIDRARQRRRRRGENTLSSGQEDEDEKERTDGVQDFNDYRRTSDDRDDGTDKQQKDGNSVSDADMIHAPHRCEGDSIETHRETAKAQRAGLPEPAAASESIGKDGARWWHEGRRSALAEIEAFAAQVQAEVIPPTCEALPVITSSSMTASTVALAAKLSGSSRKEEPMAINPAFTTIPASSVTLKQTGDSDSSTEATRREVASSAAAVAIAEEIIAVSAKRQEGHFPKEESTIHVVLADDNMHFRSMRHEVFRLARKCASMNGIIVAGL